MPIKLTKTQSQNICDALVSKSATVYKKGAIKTNQNPDSYTKLANEINKYAKNELIKDSWLRTFFMNAKEKLELSCNITLLDQCCMYAFNKTTSQYLQELTKDSVDTVPSLITQYIGTYNVHWKGTIVRETDTPITCDYSLTISQTQSIFTPIVNHTENATLKNVIYTGNPPAFIEGNLYIELMHPNKIEKIYIITHVGIAGQTH